MSSEQRIEDAAISSSRGLASTLYSAKSVGRAPDQDETPQLLASPPVACYTLGADGQSDIVKLFSVDGRLEWMNEEGFRLMNLDRFSQIEGRNWLDFWNGDFVRTEAETALARALEGKSVRFQGFCPTHLGTQQWWDVMLSPINGNDGKVERILSVCRDVTAQHENEITLRSQNHILEIMASGAPLDRVLNYLVKSVEHRSGGLSVACILILDEDGQTLRHGAAPSLPDEYNRAIDGLEIAFDTGTCCAAAFRKEVVITKDIANAPGWTKWKDLPLKLGLVAAWSMPILGSDGRVLGTFGTYFRECREPTMLERQTIDFFCKTAALAIERHRFQKAKNDSDQLIRESEEFLQSVLRSSPDCIKVLDLDGRLKWMSDNGKQAMEVCDFPKIEGALWPEFWQGETRVKAQDALVTARSGNIARFRGFCPTCAGTPKWWDVTVTAIRDDGRAPKRLLVISRDISEQIAART